MAKINNYVELPGGDLALADKLPITDNSAGEKTKHVTIEGLDVRYVTKSDVAVSSLGVKYFWSSSAARVAQTGMVDGDLGIMTDTTSNRTDKTVGDLYQRVSGAWVYQVTILLDGSVYSHDFDMDGNMLLDCQTILDQQVGPGAFFIGSSSYLSIPNNTNLNFDGDFSIRFKIHKNTLVPSVSMFIVNKGLTGTVPKYLAFQNATTGLVRFQVSDGVTNVTISEDEATYGPDTYVLRRKVGGNLTIYKNGVLQADSVVAPTGSVLNTETMFISKSSAASNYFYGSMHDTFELYNYHLTDAVAKKLSSNPQTPLDPADEYGSNTAQTSGTLVIGKRYRTDLFVAGDDFSNVASTGASANVTGAEWIAIATTPTTWTNSSEIIKLGATLHLPGSNLVLGKKNADGTYPVNFWRDNANGNNGAPTSVLASGYSLQNQEFVPVVTIAFGDFGTWTSPTWSIDETRRGKTVTLNILQTGGTIDPGATGKYFVIDGFLPEQKAVGAVSNGAFADLGKCVIDTDGKVYFSNNFGAQTSLNVTITFTTDN